MSQQLSHTQIFGADLPENVAYSLSRYIARIYTSPMSVEFKFYTENWTVNDS